MMMGDMLGAARHSAGRFQSWLEASDPALAAKVAERAAADGLSPAAYVRVAVADFTQAASGEDWATLTSAMRDSDDPGTACLVAMVDWRLNAADCGCHPSSRTAPHKGAVNE